MLDDASLPMASALAGWDYTLYSGNHKTKMDRASWTEWIEVIPQQLSLHSAGTRDGADPSSMRRYPQSRLAGSLPDAEQVSQQTQAAATQLPDAQEQALTSTHARQRGIWLG